MCISAAAVCCCFPTSFIQYSNFCFPPYFSFLFLFFSNFSFSQARLILCRLALLAHLVVNTNALKPITSIAFVSHWETQPVLFVTESETREGGILVFMFCFKLHLRPRSLKGWATFIACKQSLVYCFSELSHQAFAQVRETNKFMTSLEFSLHLDFNIPPSCPHRVGSEITFCLL